MSKAVYKALGLMSGTSLDGVDAAFLETDGERILGVGPGLTVPYSAEDRQVLEAATQAALRWQFKGAEPNSFSAAEAVIHRVHEKAVAMLCDANPAWATRLDVIGFHGQTMLHHAPEPGRKGATCQIGNGQVLAERFGVPCVFDFRSDDVAAGGQGAPLAPIYHQAMTDYMGAERPAAVLNIGGVSNVTLVEADGLSATDCGPGNGPLDEWVFQKSGINYDRDGALSCEGVPEFTYIEQWFKRDFFMKNFPKSADRYDFDVLGDIESLSVEQGAATLAAFAVAGVKVALKSRPKRLIVCGGGRHNKAMLWGLKTEIEGDVVTAEQAGFDGDMIEAQAFAYLAVRRLRELPISFPGTTGVAVPMTGGRIVYP